jgi:DNA replication and repair protein RecF
VSAVGREDAGEMQLEVKFVLGRGKEARLNGASVPSLERLRAQVATLVFTPDRLAVVKAGPAVRRSYVDRALARLYPARATLPARYADALTQRNAALRRAAAGATGADAVSPWTEQLAAVGSVLTTTRAGTLAGLEPSFREHAGELGLSDAGLAYEPSVITVEGLEARLARDMERGISGEGPHLDEVRIFADGHDLRTHGSQGEQRAAVLALLLAEADLLTAHRQVPPLLLLDDVLSELDGERRVSLADRLRARGQTLITAAASGALPGDPDQLLAVSPGAVKVQ